ncbi:unnamed protein product [Eruca vesicaria subsp. sativa]|uniref:Neprosin PEP catalytic domain-containing protein n=1 Tax=Eruca vesicaria subsp. sativa TaxID=29727 RepID=A0ABC8KAB2_ERUVS|nr:unnamed protein product [Eruca vesicaria subsp. sativa]
MAFGFFAMWFILLCICCSLMISYNHGIVEAAGTLKNVEDLDTEQELKIINKPAVKLIKSIDGERYGCVDFCKQPGFDHPSMMNHTVFHDKMRMISYLEGSRKHREKLSKQNFGHLWENGVGCPIGTVPIRRVTKMDLLRLKTLGADKSNPRGSWNNAFEPMLSSNDHHFAVTRTKREPKIYNGAGMRVAIFTPLVGPNQISSTRLHVQIGSEFIQAGWTVNPLLYQGVTTRLFVFTNAGGHQCYHSRCPDGAGMILVREDIAPGIPLDPQNVQAIDIAIIKDQSSGNWYLYVSNEEIGFWPASRFKESSGTGVEWGGEVYSPLSSPSPPMGNGRFPVGNPHYDSYIRDISIIDENYKTDNTVGNTESYTDNSHGYKVRDSTETWWKVGHLVVYGGPGKI